MRGLHGNPRDNSDPPHGADFAFQFDVSSFVTLVLAGAFALPADLEARFVRIDANGDGFISYQEAWLDPWVEHRFQLADINHDGRIDRGEFLALVTAAARAGRRQSRT